MEDIFKIATQIHDKYALTALIVLIAFAIIKLVLSHESLKGKEGLKTINRIITGIFVVSVIGIVIVAMAFVFIKTQGEEIQFTGVVKINGKPREDVKIKLPDINKYDSETNSNGYFETTLLLPKYLKDLNVIFEYKGQVVKDTIMNLELIKNLAHHRFNFNMANEPVETGTTGNGNHNPPRPAGKNLSARGIFVDRLLIDKVKTLLGKTFSRNGTDNVVEIVYSPQNLRPVQDRFSYPGGKVIIRVNEQTCYTLEQEIPVISSFGESRENILAKLNDKVTELVSLEIDPIAQHIKSCVD